MGPIRSTPSRSVTIATAVIAAIILGTFGYDQWQRYENALAEADRDTRNAAVVLAEHTARTFESVTQTLRAVEELHHDVIVGVYQDKATIHRLLAAIHGGSPELRSIGWTDAAGNRIASSLFADPPPLNIAEQEHFTAHRDGAVQGLYIAAPIRSKLTGEWVINASIRLQRPDGSFAGTAGGVIDPGYFASVYRSIELGPSRVAALVRSDGTILAREPASDEWLGKSLSESRLFREFLPTASAGSYHGRTVLEGAERIVSFARVPQATQAVVVTLLRSDALAGFHQGLIRSAARMGFTLTALLLGAWILLLQLARRERAEGKFRGLLESAPDAMIIADQEDRISLVNARTETLFGYRRQELLGRPMQMLIPDWHRTPDVAEGGSAMAGPHGASAGPGLALDALRKDGSTFPVEISLSPLQTEEGSLVSSAIRDITERQRAQADLAAARQAAEAASRAKTDFLARMSHELRTPLNAVIGFAQMLQIDREHTLTSRQIDYASYILRGGHHLLALVNDVLDLNAIETGRLHLSIERVGVREMLDYVRSSMGSIAAASGVELDVSTPAAIADVRADQLRLRQVLINLVSNAIKYNRPGGAVALTALAAPGDQVRFVVTDTGIGIAPERQQDLFQPFNRLGAEYTGIEGTGIGLALSRQLVESMNGKIGFTSELGRGSTFWVELPAEAAGTGAADRTPAAHGTPASGGYSLLYIEDNPTSLRLMEHLISTLPGVAMLSAPTPQLGLDLAMAHRPDVIVLDLNLPGMHGLEVLNRLKGTADTRSIPVIALTAAAFPSDLKRGFAAGFFRYLTKPLDVKAFLAAVDDALASTRLRGNGSA